jgi:hypothetical protein
MSAMKSGGAASVQRQQRCRSRRPRLALTVFAVAVGVAVAVQSGSAKVKVRTDFNKKFDFTQAHTWGWRQTGAGQIMLARAADDDKEAVRRQVEPIIVSAVEKELPRRGLTAAAATPDVTVAYFLLLTIGSSAQTMGQFLPTTTAWALPPFVQSTQSLEIIQQGALVIDISANGDVVWRGVAEAEIKMDLPTNKRVALVQEAVEKLVSRFPPKTKT